MRGTLRGLKRYYGIQLGIILLGYLLIAVGDLLVLCCGAV